MSFRAKANGHHFAIYGELAAAVRKEQESLSGSGSGGMPLAKKSLALLNDTAIELLRTAPHECDVDVELAGSREADGSGELLLKIKLAPAAKT
jgi:hypothetical protein